MRSVTRILSPPTRRVRYVSDHISNRHNRAAAALCDGPREPTNDDAHASLLPSATMDDEQAMKDVLQDALDEVSCRRNVVAVILRMVACSWCPRDRPPRVSVKYSPNWNGSWLSCVRTL